MTRALLALGRPEAAIREADYGLAVRPFRPFPHQLILKYRGISRLALGQSDVGCADLRHAADLSFARGPLLRFGFSTALAELAVFLLGQSDNLQEAHECVRRFAGTLRTVPGLAEAASVPLALEQLLDRQPQDTGKLIGLLRQAANCFPY